MCGKAPPYENADPIPNWLLIIHTQKGVWYLRQRSGRTYVLFHDSHRRRRSQERVWVISPPHRLHPIKMSSIAGTVLGKQPAHNIGRGRAKTSGAGEVKTVQNITGAKQHTIQLRKMRCTKHSTTYTQTSDTRQQEGATSKHLGEGIDVSERYPAGV